jgi:hypothetical protein
VARALEDLFSSRSGIEEKELVDKDLNYATFKCFTAERAKFLSAEEFPDVFCKKSAVDCQMRNHRQYVQCFGAGSESRRRLYYTKRKLRLGQEIAMTIKLPDAADFFMVTGEVVRISSEGFGLGNELLQKIFNHLKALSCCSSSCLNQAGISIF